MSSAVKTVDDSCKKGECPSDVNCSNGEVTVGEERVLRRKRKANELNTSVTCSVENSPPAKRLNDQSPNVIAGTEYQLRRRKQVDQLGRDQTTEVGCGPSTPQSGRTTRSSTRCPNR